MATRRMRAVADGERAPTKKPTTIAEAADVGTPRDQLVLMRKRIAKALDEPNCSTRDLASLSKRLMEITREIETIDERSRDDGDEETPPDAEWEAV